MLLQVARYLPGLKRTTMTTYSIAVYSIPYGNVRVYGGCLG